MSTQGTSGVAGPWFGGFAVAPGDPPAPGRSIPELLLSSYLAQADFVLEALKRSPLLVRYHEARRLHGLSAGDWALGLVTWSLALYDVAIDAESDRLELAELLSADGRPSAAALVAVARRRLRIGLDLNGVAQAFAEDPRWTGRALGRFAEGEVQGRRVRALGAPRLDPMPAALEVGRTGVGRMMLAQSVVLSESYEPSISELYAALRRLAVELARGGSSLPVLGGAVVPALRLVLSRQAQCVWAPRQRGTSVPGG